MNQLRNAWAGLWLVVVACSFDPLASLTAPGDDAGPDVAAPPIDGMVEAGSLELVAGDIGGAGNGDGVAIAARFDGPAGVAVDAAGNLYIADRNNHTIRKLAPGGVVTTVAGSPGIADSLDGTGAAARFNGPTSVAADATGTLYIADQGNHTIRKITPAGVVSTWAGLAGVPGSADGSGSGARFNLPAAVAVDAAGTVYVADASNDTIRKITADRTVITLAGSPGLTGSADGTGAAARFGVPTGIAVDAAGTIYVADHDNQTIRKVTPTGVVTTFAGTAGAVGGGDGTGAAARFRSPAALAFDGAGTLYVADQDNSAIRQISAAGVVTTLAGSAQQAGSNDGTGDAARFAFPSGVAVDAAGVVYVADQDNNTVRRITATGIVTTAAGAPLQFGAVDATGAAARFNFPAGVGADGAHDLYVADSNNHVIRKITAGGTAMTLAGKPGVSGSADGTGSAARFEFPAGLAVDAAGTIYVTDQAGHNLRKITPAGVVTTLAGMSETPGSADGTGAAARFTAPADVAVDAAGNVYVADQGNHTIRKVTAAGAVTTIAGSPGALGSADGTGPAARFRFPSGVVVDPAGNLFVADQSNHTIRKVTADGVVTTIAGSAGLPGSADGTGAAARFRQPSAIELDAAGNLYVTDLGNSSLRKITPAGITTTIAGTAGTTGIQLGPVPRFVGPRGLVLVGDSLALSDANAILRLVGVR